MLCERSGFFIASWRRTRNSVWPTFACQPTLRMLDRTLTCARGTQSTKTSIKGLILEKPNWVRWPLLLATECSNCLSALSLFWIHWIRSPFCSHLRRRTEPHPDIFCEPFIGYLDKDAPESVVEARGRGNPLMKKDGVLVLPFRGLKSSFGTS